MAPPSPAFPPTDPRQPYHSRVIAVGGPPHSGKSVFLAELYRQLLQRQASGIFLQRACPDGEGMWSNEADPAIVQQIRKKFAFSEEFVTLTLQTIERLGRNPQLSLVLLDLGGKRTAENAEILRRSTHCILLSAQAEETANLADFCGCRSLPDSGNLSVAPNQTPRSDSRPRRSVFHPNRFAHSSRYTRQSIARFGDRVLCRGDRSICRLVNAGVILLNRMA